MVAGSALATLVLDQKRWSNTASALKKSIGRARWIVLGLAGLGAILETWGAQIHTTSAGHSLVFGYGGAAALAIAAVLRHWKLGHERVQAWILARSGSESFKREMYLFRTRTGPYASDQREDALLNRRQEILTKLQSVQKYRVDLKTRPETPGWLDAQGYLAERIEGPKGQIQWLTDRAVEYSRRLGLLNASEFLLALAGALLGAALTITGKQAYGAWVAVITTISGAIAAHALAQRYEQLLISYRAAADRLSGTVARWNAKNPSNIAQLVEPCEAVLLEENQGWIAGADQLQGQVAASQQGKPQSI
jgi:SMODS and SLOG-associating 2TM effector domain 1/Protein of unknown function (DUF4231)